ncbi:hypothetical protein CHGG_10518 [Chaetomium globosum CBS 148.51]|uniref:GPI inositol-deacylase winged helix domain-containing protein n=1 Tax=Chaetomium globosum (strain ATCC 6205 / CBS 148.51 / DSM 1962 / NBRC 6347 / NRRL 1970) TaxID=306901 RepID=Q2GND6_CHAGB|nr:uncharacterized protein CHGG_10518 [Chaetomium globosum CBS 148.51]EAQ84114.1 hypothetical protein CHGG_10518 [Chaetomium globosum CBS 148.51]
MAPPNVIPSVPDAGAALQGTPKTDKSHLRLINSIIASPSVELAKCIFSWAVSAPRPLSIHELAEAVKLDIGQTLTAPLSEQLEKITAQLITVDSQSRVHIVDETVSDFLTQPREDGKRWIDRPTADSRIAEICLEILGGDDFTPSKRQSGGVSNGSNKYASPLSAYAAAHFAHHLAHSSPAVGSHLARLDRFFRTNVLTWIERLAEWGDLAGVLRAARGIETYLRQRKNSCTATAIEAAQIDRAEFCVTEIDRLIALFHAALLAMPSSVHLLLPPLCPLDSIIRKNFGTSTEGLRIVGRLDQDWGDRLTCYLLPGKALSVACCDRVVSIGVSNNDIELYSTNTFEFDGALPNRRNATGSWPFDSTSSFFGRMRSGDCWELWDVR